LEYKTCKKCKIEKELNEKNFIYRKNGDYWEGKCRECNNLDRRRKDSNGNIVTNISPKINNKSDNIKKDGKKEYKTMNIFNDDEILVIKALIKDYPEIKKSIKSNKIELHKVDNKRVRKTITIDEDLDNIINTKMIQTHLNYSDIINLLVRKSIEYID